MPKLFCVLMFWAACAAAQTVEGSVVNPTGQGIAGVKVEILQAGDTVHFATTDPQGYFRIEAIKPGTYTVRYSSRDYWREQETPRPFQVTAGGNPVKLEARMTPLGRITGRVIDSRGKPVPNAYLELTESGILHLAAKTDANGRFHFHQLVYPGVYTLAVHRPADWKPPEPEPESGRLLGWARTYYSGTAIPEAAAKIVLPAGGEFLDIEMKLLAVPVHSVRGVILKPDGMPASRVTITLGEEAVFIDRARQVRVESKSDGTFEFTGVVDGKWRLSAEADMGGVKLRVAQWIELVGRDLQEVKLRLNAPFPVRGKVVLETSEGATAPRMPAVRLLYAREKGLLRFLEAPDATPNASGDFSLPRVYPGGYQFFMPEPPAYYLDAVRLGDVAIAAPEVPLFSGASGITLVYKTNGGTVRGTVEKCAAGGVVLIPQDPAVRWPGTVRSARCDSNDRYEITAVRPGEYYAVAFSQVWASRLPNNLSANGPNDYYAVFVIPREDYLPVWAPKFDDGLLNQGARITVRGGEVSVGDLRAITVSPY